MNFFRQLLVLGVVVYGLCWMIGGPQAANGFARGVDRTAQRVIRYVGRSSGRAALNYPFAAGIIVIILMLAFMSRC